MPRTEQATAKAGARDHVVVGVDELKGHNHERPDDDVVDKEKRLAGHGDADELPHSICRSCVMQ